MSTNWPRVSIGLLLALFLTGCRADARKGMPITVGSTDAPEQILIGKVTALTLRSHGYQVIDKTAMGDPRTVRAALEAGTIDVCWEYTGDTWFVHLGHDQPISDPQGLFEKIRAQDAYHQITWLSMADCQRTQSLVVHADMAEEYNIATISDLKRHIDRVNPDVRLCTPRQFYGLAGGVGGLERVYQFRFREDLVRFMSVREGYQAVSAGECDCALGFSLDSEAQGAALRPLYDDRGFFQRSNLAVALRTPALQQHRDLKWILPEIAALLDQATVAELHYQVTIQGEGAEAVARRFLTQRGMIGPRRSDQEQSR